MSNDGTMFSAGVPIFSETTDLIVNQERGKAVARTLGDKGALILRNHGIVTAGSTIEHAVFLAIKLEKACRIQMLAEQAGGPKLFVKEEELAAKRSRTNRGDSQGNAFSYLVRRWHLRCNCEVPKEYQADSRTSTAPATRAARASAAIAYRHRASTMSKSRLAPTMNFSRRRSGSVDDLLSPPASVVKLTLSLK